MPFTVLSSATAAAKLLVGPVLTSSRPSLCWSIGSPVGHAASVNGAVPDGKRAMNAFVGHPVALSHAAWTSLVFPGSNSPGVTVWNVDGSPVVLSSDRSTFSALPPDAAPETRPAVAATSSVTNGTFFSRFLTSATSLYGLSYLLVCLGRLASPPCGRCARGPWHSHRGGRPSRHVQSHTFFRLK